MSNYQMPIESLPDNAYLPKELHAQADSYREALRRVGAIRRSAAEATAKVTRTELEDAEALRAAVLAGKPLPAEQAPALREAIADTARRVPVAEDEAYRLGEALAVELRNRRDEIAARIAEALTAALDGYLDALDDAERTVHSAYANANAVSALLTFIKTIDDCTRITQRAQNSGVPAFSAARNAAEELKSVADSLTASRTGAPRYRRVKLDDGRVLSLTSEALRSLTGATGRRVVEILDGYGHLEGLGPIGDPAKF